MKINKNVLGKVFAPLYNEMGPVARPARLRLKNNARFLFVAQPGWSRLRNPSRFSLNQFGHKKGSITYLIKE
jgi:hypothetical protein